MSDQEEELREMSRRKCKGRAFPPTESELMLGCMQRTADALEQINGSINANSEHGARNYQLQIKGLEQKIRSLESQFSERDWLVAELVGLLGISRRNHADENRAKKEVDFLGKNRKA